MPDDGWHPPRSGGHIVPIVPVEELRQKFGLLLKYVPNSSWAALARHFGKPVGTVKYWGHGSAQRDADQMPDWAVPVLVDLFATILPPGHAQENVRRLVLGPAAYLEEEIRSAAAWSLSAIIAREGKTGTALLFRKPEGGNLIELEGEEASSDVVRLSLGVLFRIEFPIDRTESYAVALQHAQQSWSVVPAIVSETGKRLLVPGRPGDTAPRFMHERRDAGLHRFVCFQAAVPFPAALAEHDREGSVLDKRAIEALAALYENVPASRRSCHVLAIAFEPPHDDRTRPPPAV